MNKKIEISRNMLLEYLKEQLLAKNITQDQLSQITGFTQSNISRMLAGKYSPSLDNFLKLCEAANVFVFIIDKEADEDTAELMRNRWGKVNPN